VEEALFLAKFVRQVTVVTRGPRLRATKVAQERALGNPRIQFRFETTVAEFHGHRRMASVLLRNTRTGDTEEASPAGVFVLIGQEPNTGWLKGQVALDERGFIVTDGSLQTSLGGVFAAGDARAGSTKQLVVAAGEGAMAALAIRHYLSEGA